MSDLISRQAAISILNSFDVMDGYTDQQTAIRLVEQLPSAEPKEVYCPMASRTCFANGKEVVWCLTCPYISEEDRELVKKAVEGSKPKTGKWIVYKAPDKYHCGLVKCPFCEEEMIAEADEYNYCPNCGARMKGEQNANND